MFLSDIFFYVIMLLFHLLPFLIIIKSNKIRENRILFIICLISSLVPIISLLYMIFYFITCGVGCFNGIFFLFTLVPAFILTIVGFVLKIVLERRS